MYPANLPDPEQVRELANNSVVSLVPDAMDDSSTAVEEDTVAVEVTEVSGDWSEEMVDQVKSAIETKGNSSVQDLLNAGDTWVVD